MRTAMLAHPCSLGVEMKYEAAAKSNASQSLNWAMERSDKSSRHLFLLLRSDSRVGGFDSRIGNARLKQITGHANGHGKWWYTCERHFHSPRSPLDSSPLLLYTLLVPLLTFALLGPFSLPNGILYKCPLITIHKLTQNTVALLFGQRVW